MFYDQDPFDPTNILQEGATIGPALPFGEGVNISSSNISEFLANEEAAERAAYTMD